VLRQSARISRRTHSVVLYHAGDKQTCPDCGAVLAADAPGGFCPGCLLAAGGAASVSICALAIWPYRDKFWTSYTLL